MKIIKRKKTSSITNTVCSQLSVPVSTKSLKSFVQHCFQYKQKKILKLLQRSWFPFAEICSVSQLSTDKSDNWLFGYNTGSPTGHTMYSAYGALHFGGNQTEQYMGTTTVRGMLVNQWKSCLYWPSKDATMTVNWYFTGREPA